MKATIFFINLQRANFDYKTKNWCGYYIYMLK